MCRNGEPSVSLELSLGKREGLLGGIKKRPIFGTKTSTSGLLHRRKLLKRLTSTLGYADQQLYSMGSHVDFFCYNEKDDSNEEVEEPLATKEDEVPLSNMFQDISINVVDYLSERRMGNARTLINLRGRLPDISRQSQSDFALRHLLTNGILQEKRMNIEDMNKIFCSQWLSDRQVVFGTKCNKLMVLDVRTKHMTQIPSLPPSSRSLLPDKQSGIHAVEINPSKTMLATGGENPNDVAVYRLPTFDPLSVGELAHRDWVYALTWLDDQFLVSGSKDTTLAVWKISDPDDVPGLSQNTSSVHTSGSHIWDDFNIPSHSYMKAVSVKKCKSAQGVRVMVFNNRLDEIACLSLNGYIHVWSSEKFVQKYSRKLQFSPSPDNMCLSVHEDYGLYAIGSKSHTTLMDARTLQCVNKIPSKIMKFGIRSISFYSSLLSMGTGQGSILFYDLRAGKYLEPNINSMHSSDLTSNFVWNDLDDPHYKYHPAINTHCVDSTGTRIFAAGGPVEKFHYGNYIGLWH